MIQIHSSIVIVLLIFLSSASAADKTDPLKIAFNDLAAGRNINGAIDTLCTAAESDLDSKENKFIRDFAYDRLGNSLTKNNERCQILSKAIPVLIEELKGKQDKQAYQILITLQSDCPRPEYALWREWWVSKGKSKFASE